MSGKTVILVNPRPADWNDFRRELHTPPVGLMSIASVLRAGGADPKIVDFPALRYEEDEEAIRFMVSQPDCPVIGFSVMTVQVPHFIQLLGTIKRAMPEVKTIAGGVHPAMHPGQTIGHPGVDYVCTGAGEYTLLELLDHLSAGASEDKSHIKGLVWKRGSEVVTNARRRLHDLNELPFMAYDTIDLKRYVNRNVHLLDRTRIARKFELHTGQGCPFRCAFCINSLPQYHNRQYKGKSAERILDEIEHLIRVYRAEHISFADEMFFMSRKRVRKLLEGIRARKLSFTWTTNVRADLFRESYINRELVEELEESGCIALLMGAESGSQRILDLLQKDIRVEDILNAAQSLAGTKIVGGFSFMCGVPTETTEEIKATFRLIGRLFEVNPNTHIFGPGLFRPYPGTKLHAMCVEYGYRDPKSLEEWVLDNVATGYHNVTKSGWIDSWRDLLNLQFYGKVAFTPVEPMISPLAVLAHKLLRPVARFRFDHDFFGLPVERLAYENSRAFVQKLRFRGAPASRPS